LVNRRLGRLLERVEDAEETAAEAFALVDLVLQSPDVLAHEHREIGWALTEDRPYLVEAEPESPQRDDPVQAPDVGLAVEAMSRPRAL
jgi:hypothetical protein